MVGNGQILGNLIHLAVAHCRRAGNLTINRAALNAHIYLARAHRYTGSAQGLNRFGRIFAVAADFQTGEIIRRLNRLFAVSKLYKAIICPNQRTHALLLQLCAQLVAQAAVDSLANLFIGREEERQVEHVHRRNDACPTAYGIQAHINAAANQCIIHIFIIKQLACRINLDVQGAAGFFRRLSLQVLHGLHQRMALRQMRCHFQSNLAAGRSSLLIGAATTASD